MSIDITDLRNAGMTEETKTRKIRGKTIIGISHIFLSCLVTIYAIGRTISVIVQYPQCIKASPGVPGSLFITSSGEDCGYPVLIFAISLLFGIVISSYTMFTTSHILSKLCGAAKRARHKQKKIKLERLYYSE